MSLVRHIAAAADWANRSATYAPSSWREEGFVHCSTDGQLVRTANKHFAGRTDLVLLTVDTDAVSPLVVWEDTSGAGEDYPHIYGPIEVSAVVAARPFAAGPDGRFDWWSPGN